ncbi:carotenoid biosynthesis protein [Prevotella melaninogenica]|uniref:Carotenoid biosynthesis protein n=1 Tax=Prevotella melaninogenica TaxID=28132 RepID=A0A7D4KCE6_9BACT|nr:carotenoid biosynthesis protein [Prevotella melaninogenica]EFC73145.1 hypothetical protein HMPREF0660_01332 [Prevotella melaninogenica D18]QKH88236.1 carotenoid biosynthesis protein [Prevotella melaninogenica]
MKEYRFKWIDWVVVVLVMAFYTYGAFGLTRGETRELYTSLTPLVLLSSLFILCIYDRSPKHIKALIYILSVVIVSFSVEFLGVATGVIFGEYGYGTSLGPKIAGTPLLIGINWIFLVYATAAIQAPLGRGVITTIVIPTLLMLGYDAIMEQVAPMMQMWSWEGGSVPLQNYLVWGALAGLFHTVKYWLRIDFRNRIAPFIFFIQILFFSIILAL